MSSPWTEVFPAFRFVVEVEGLPPAQFHECTLPTLEVEVEEEKEGGFNQGTHLLPGRVKRGNLTLKRGLGPASPFLRWYADVMQGNLGAVRKQVSVTLLDSLGVPVMRWDMIGVYPTKWTGPSLNTSSKDLAIETLELTFESVTVT